MKTPAQSRKEESLREAMEAGEAVAENTQGFNGGRYESVAKLDDYEALKAQAREIKEQAVENLPTLLEKVREQIKSRGGSVYVADSAEDANRYISEVSKDADRLVKSKSMTTEEIEVNEYLEADGVEVIETDLGEWVLQIAEEAPSHIVAPAIHKSRASIAELFNQHFDPQEPLETAEELTEFARRKLGHLIEEADVGMTGANFITADTGTLALVTSEGNARKSALVPPTYIAVAGLEKIVPTIEDLYPFIELIGKSGTGQDLTSYLSLFTPPFDSPPIDFDQPNRPVEPVDRSFHLVLLDNGRMKMRDDSQLRETLYCIRCGACANSCANFQQVGGHAFGGETYSGGIATGWEAGVHGLESADSFNDLCTGCSRCVDACPVNIDIPWINVVVRDRINQKSKTTFDWLVDGLRPGEEEGASFRQRLFGRFETLAWLGSATAPLSNWVNQLVPVRALLEWGMGIDQRRSLPRFASETLRDWFLARDNSGASATDRTVVLYPDVYTNYIRVDRGKAAVRVLEALGIDVEVPEVPGSGRAPLSQGMITQAEQKAKAVWEALRDPVHNGKKIVVIEPTDLAMFERRYEKFLSEEAALSLRESTTEVMDYIRQILEAKSTLPNWLRPGDQQAVAYHSHCQQRTLDLERPTVRLLESLGYDVETSSAECCGMAGSFGYKSEYYELSMKVGDELQEEMAEMKAPQRTVVASGTSCKEQLQALLDEPVPHPIQLIAPQA